MQTTELLVFFGYTNPIEVRSYKLMFQDGLLDMQIGRHKAQSYVLTFIKKVLNYSPKVLTSYGKT